jgi:hypothetical protein
LKFIGLLKKFTEGVNVTIWAANFDMSIFFVEYHVLQRNIAKKQGGECKKLTLHHITNTNFLRVQLSNFLNITPF